MATNRRWVSPGVELVVGVVLSLGLVWAQDSFGSLRGQITDPSGRSIPNAVVTAAGVRTAAQTVRSDIQGRYQFRNLAPGVYRVRVVAKGFAPYLLENREVAAGGAQVLDIALQLAS